MSCSSPGPVDPTEELLLKWGGPQGRGWGVRGLHPTAADSQLWDWQDSALSPSLGPASGCYCGSGAANVPVSSISCPPFLHFCRAGGGRGAGLGAFQEEVPCWAAHLSTEPCAVCTRKPGQGRWHPTSRGLGVDLFCLPTHASATEAGAGAVPQLPRNRLPVPGLWASSPGPLVRTL